MASTLGNFGIPLGGGTGRGGLLAVKVRNKFRVVVTNFGLPTSSISLTQNVMSVDRPTYTTNSGTLHSYNSTEHYAGKAEWSTITLKVRDDVTNAMSILVSAQVQKQINLFEQTTPLSGSAYKFSMIIDTLDGGNDIVLDSWFIEGCFLTSTNYGSLDYSNSDTVEIDMTIQFDNATLNTMSPFPIFTPDTGFNA